MKRYEFNSIGSVIRKREWNGAGDLIHDGLLIANALTGGLIDAATGGRISGPCQGCEERRDTANRVLPFHRDG